MVYFSFFSKLVLGQFSIKSSIVKEMGTKLIWSSIPILRPLWILVENLYSKPILEHTKAWFCLEEFCVMFAIPSMERGVAINLLNHFDGKEGGVKWKPIRVHEHLSSIMASIKK
jgi:hypothetical protein